MTSPANPFKARLQAGTPQIGLWLSLAQPYTAEICATAGFQWLLVDGEHAPNHIGSTLAQLQAIAAYAPQGVEAVVRVVEGTPAQLKQVLDIGAQTVLVPMVETAEQAAALVAATRYPPRGVRGMAASIARASRWGARPGYAQQAHDEVCLLVQAESVTALQNLEAICAVDGVDGVFIGPADLAASMGHLGDAGHPEVRAAIDQALRTTVASGKAAGILTGHDADAQQALALGATFVAVGIDVALLAQAARSLAGRFGRPLAVDPAPSAANRAADRSGNPY